MNLLVQSGLNIFAGLATMFLLPRYLLRDASWPIVGTLSAASFLALPAADYRHRYFLGDQPYGVAFALCLGGLLLVVLAHWVNSATALLIGPLVGFRCLLGGVAVGREPDRDSRRPRLARVLDTARQAAGTEAGIVLLLLAAGFASGLGLMLLASPRTRVGLIPLGEWPTGWRELADKVWMVFGWSSWMLVLVRLLLSDPVPAHPARRGREATDDLGAPPAGGPLLRRHPGAVRAAAGRG